MKGQRGRRDGESLQDFIDRIKAGSEEDSKKSAEAHKELAMIYQREMKNHNDIMQKLDHLQAKSGYDPHHQMEPAGEHHDYAEPTSVCKCVIF